MADKTIKRDQCRFCASRQCYVRISSVDDGGAFTFDDLACPDHVKELERYADGCQNWRKPTIRRHSTSNVKQRRGDPVGEEGVRYQPYYRVENLPDAPTVTTSDDGSMSVTFPAVNPPGSEITLAATPSGVRVEHGFRPIEAKCEVSVSVDPDKVAAEVADKLKDGFDFSRIPEAVKNTSFLSVEPPPPELTKLVDEMESRRVSSADQG